MKRLDGIVVGQGIAGTTLAWRLIERGARVLIADRGDRQTPSRLAAGLITPVTGRRLAISSQWFDYWPVAEAFYRRVEQRLGAALLSTTPALRLFDSEAEQAVFRSRLGDARFRELVSPRADAADARVDAAYGGFEMRAGGRLDVPRYLDRSRAWFTERHAFAASEIGPQDLRVGPTGVAIDSLAVTAPWVVFARGDADRADFGGSLAFEPVKGEMLTIRSHGLRVDRVLHRGVWLAPCGKDAGPSLYRVGATYDRTTPDTVPTPEGRARLLGKLRRLVKRPIEVVDHSAAVRPVLARRRPYAAWLPGRPRLGCFNGLGSKGALGAPLLARDLADELLRGAGRACAE